MATNTSKVFIDIITQFTGTKSIKQAETSFDKLAKSIGRVVSVAAIEEFSRASIKAFLADNAAANQLIKTLDNLGIAFNPGSLDAYIQNLQNTTGVLDDQLRPAFAQLAVATKDYTTSQSLLSTALDVSQGTGKSLSAVTTALSKAYLGNFAAISRLGAGISKAQIKAGNFNDIQKTLNQNFGGAALAAADTYAGKLRIVGAAFTDVKETIGKGFVDAFSNLVGENGSATKFASSLRDAAQYIADIIVGLSVIGTKLSALPGAGIFKELANISKQFSGINLIANLGKTKRVSGIANDSYSRQKQLLVSQNKSLVVSKELVKATTAQTKANKDKLAAEKASLVLKTAAKVLDVDQAQILAALGRDISEADKDRLRLQQALLNENADAAGKLAMKVLEAQQAALMASFVDPFGNWTNSAMEAFIAVSKLLEEMRKLTSTTGKDPFWYLGNTTDPTSEGYIDPLGIGVPPIDYGYTPDNLSFDFGRGNMPDAVNPYSWFAGSAPYNPMNGNTPSSTTINLVVDGQILTSVVTNGQQNTSASGVSPAVSRLNPYSSGF